MYTNILNNNSRISNMHINWFRKMIKKLSNSKNDIIDLLTYWLLVSFRCTLK